MAHGAPSKVESEALIEAIVKISISGSAAQERQQNEVIRSIKTLDQLTEALQREGFNAKHSSTYLHLLPQNSRSEE